MNENNTSKRQFFWAGIIIFWFYFVLMGIPNFVASDDFGMIMVFDPDEAAPLPSVFDMIKPQETLVSAVKNFLTYQYYIYGFPYFAYSALVILPLKFFGSLSDQFPLIMLILRQATSVLPMVFSAYWLVNLQTKYRNLWVGIFLLVFLLAVPAVVQNNFWWHPDGLTMLTVVATIYFLNRDNFTYGLDFLWAAFACGISTGIKFTGVYFVLTIGVYLLWGFQRKHLSIKGMFWQGIRFVVVMLIGFIISNPLFLHPEIRQRYIDIFYRQSNLLSQGYNVEYARGLAVSSPVITRYYGSWVFIFIALAAPVYGIIRNRDRLLNVLILTWVIPTTIFILTVTHFKFQYWLPVALPLFSSLSVFWPDVKILVEKKQSDQKAWSILALIAIIVVLVQFVGFLGTDYELYTTRLNRLDNSDSVNFYYEMVSQVEGLEDRSLKIYRDVRLYVPDSSQWDVIWEFDLLTYDYFEKENPDVILLMQQRIRDYLNPNVTGIDQLELETSRIFYRDADAGEISGYCLVFRNSFGLAFLRNTLCDELISN